MSILIMIWLQCCLFGSVQNFNGQASSTNIAHPKESGRIEITVSEDFGSKAGTGDDDQFQRFRVYVFNSVIRKEMVYVEDHFELSVPAGIYEIELRSMEGEPIRFRRGSFRVKSNRTTKLSLLSTDGETEVCDNEHGFVFEPLRHNPRRTAFPEVKYQSYKVDQVDTLVIKSCNVKQGGNLVSFSPGFASLDNLMVSANKIEVNRARSMLRGSGKAQVIITLVGSDCVKTGEAIRVRLKKDSGRPFACDDVTVED